VLQEKEFRRVGGSESLKADVRIVAASNRDLEEQIKDGSFREDLFYRLNVITIHLPALADRREDIPLLVEHFVAKHGAGRVRAVDRAALRRLTSYAWPGNVRQLENEVMRASVLADDVIREEHLSPEICAMDGSPGGPRDDLDLRAHLEAVERVLVERALTTFGGNQSKAAAALGVSRFGLQKKLHRLRLASRRRGPE
jgi:DNA-binding NtrC family response regulator